MFDFVDGGAGDELSMMRSRGAYRRVEFRPIVLRDVSKVDTSALILGRRASAPLVLAPTGMTRLMHRAGEAAVARSAFRAGLPYTLSIMGTTSIEALAAAVPEEADRWYQMYLWRDRDLCLQLLQRAIAARYSALVLTVDVPVAGQRLRDIRNGTTVPPRMRPRDALRGLRRPRWWLDTLRTPPLRFASLGAVDGDVLQIAHQQFDPSASLQDLAWLREAWPGKLVVKGLQSAEDARLFAGAGADAVVVSNHGGRQLDRSRTPLEALPSVAAAVGPAVEVFVDGGVQSGADVVAAVCLGATAVLVGRAYLYGLMSSGEVGVDRAITILTDEVRRTMQLLGSADVRQLTAERAILRDH